jgi:hypothetical protein
MRIVDRATFMALPYGTIYQEYHDGDFPTLMVKGSEGDPIPEEEYASYTSTQLTFPWFPDEVFDKAGTNDPWDIILAMADDGVQRPLAFDGTSSDHAYADRKFAVWDPEDVRGLITVLQAAPGVTVTEATT